MSDYSLIYDNLTAKWLKFSDIVEIISVLRKEDVCSSLAYVTSQVESLQLHAVGFLSYEAGAAFDSSFPYRSIYPFPLAWFGLYRKLEQIELDLRVPKEILSSLNWKSSITSEQYCKNISKIKKHLACGDSYQVNFTYRLKAFYSENAWDLFPELVFRQGASYVGFIDAGRYAICSASPELFFFLSGEKITSKPMKGTAARGHTQVDDKFITSELFKSEKIRAENTMIVDMVRNDLARISKTGSVTIDKLFDIEKYSTLWQMTSTVSAETDASIPEIFESMFPCASITGCPKSRTMEIIQEIEQEPRKVYTGCIGYISPNRKAQFNVAIRTIIYDKELAELEYGTGGGITWDSLDEEEYEESKTKTLVILKPVPEFSLFETMLWEREKGVFLLERHLKRLSQSAEYFDFPFKREKVCNVLNEALEKRMESTLRVHLIISFNGEEVVKVGSFGKTAAILDNVVKVRLARDAINSTDRFLYHKTTIRKAYDFARAECAEDEDVIFYNENAEITESSIANIVVKLDGILYTPPVRCGLLAGTFREELLERNEIYERVISVDELRRATELYLINSLRRWRKGLIVL